VASADDADYGGDSIVGQAIDRKCNRGGCLRFTADDADDDFAPCDVVYRNSPEFHDHEIANSRGFGGFGVVRNQNDRDKSFRGFRGGRAGSPLP
jgi:hypothetical protein